MAEKSAEIECMTWRTVALILAAVGVAEALVVSSVTPTLVAGACTISMWEQKDEVTVSYRNCAAHCTPGAHDYLWPTLVSRRTGSCR